MFQRTGYFFATPNTKKLNLENPYDYVNQEKFCQDASFTMNSMFCERYSNLVFDVLLNAGIPLLMMMSRNIPCHQMIKSS